MKDKASNRESFLKSRYTEKVARETFDNIVSEQDALISEYDLNRTGLLKSKAKRYFQVDIEGEGIRGTLTVLKYMRFLDMKELQNMKRRKQYQIYNRVVFGNIYGGYIPQLRYGFTDSVKQELAQEYKIEL